MIGVHSALAWAANAPEFALDTMEANEFAKATKELMDHYPDQMRWLDGKTGAWINFSQTALVIYGSKLTALKMRRAAQRPRAVVVPIRAESAQQPVMQGSPRPMPQPAPLAETMNGNSGDAAPVPLDVRTGEIPGVGLVEFPPDHPLFKKPTVN